MKKKQYQAPQVKVMAVQQSALICASTYGNRSLYEEDLDNSSFHESSAPGYQTRQQILDNYNSINGYKL